MKTRGCVRAASIAAFFVCITPMARATTIEGPIYDPYSNENLYVVPLGSWTQSESAAEDLGGNLMTIHSDAENAFVVNDVLLDLSGGGGPNLSQLPLWVGLYDPTGAASDDGPFPAGPGSQHAANFIWVDGSNSAYRNWSLLGSNGQPDDAPPGEYYAAINWTYALNPGAPPDLPGTWNDTPLNGTAPGAYPGNTGGPYYGIAAVPVPEPASMILLVCGGAALTVLTGRVGALKSPRRAIAPL
jgi:hypothetical protein